VIPQTAFLVVQHTYLVYPACLVMTHASNHLKRRYLNIVEVCGVGHALQVVDPRKVEVVCACAAP
jgi:hypothetical protein